MNNNPLLSVCCVSYNHEKFIPKCLESIWNQDYKNIEIVVVDDGSSDNSVNILENLKSKSPFPMTILTQQNTGNIGKNFNRAINSAKGKFIAFISCDDFFYEDMASSQIDIFEKNENIILIGCSQITGVNDLGIVNNELLPPLKINSIPHPNIDDLLDLEFNLEGCFYIQGSIFKKDAVDLVGGFDNDMTGDDIILRTKLFLYIKNNPQNSFKIIDRPCCYYRIHNNNIHKNSIRQMKIVAEYLEKYWPTKNPPKIFYQWLKHTIINNSLKEIFKLFNYNKTLRNSFLKIKILKYILRKITKG
jgi:alpha-1,3-rhamnosyltransferase